MIITEIQITIQRSYHHLVVQLTLSDLAVCSKHVAKAKDGESDGNGDQEVISDQFEVHASVFVGIKKYTD